MDAIITALITGLGRGNEMRIRATLSSMRRELELLQGFWPPAAPPPLQYHYKKILSTQLWRVREEHMVNVKSHSV